MMAFGEAVLRLAIGRLFLIKISLQLEPASATNLAAHSAYGAESLFQILGILISTRDFKCTLMSCCINTPALQQMTIPHISGSQTEAHIRITWRAGETTEYFVLPVEFLSQFV